jgi:hypothetical protein
LDRAKARLTYFLRSLLEQSSSFILDVQAAQGNWEIKDNNELEAFLEELPGLSFLPPKHETESSTKKGDIYVFSTACDTGLKSFLLANNNRPVNLFVIQPAEKGAKTEKETLNLSGFYLNGILPSASLLSKNKVKPLGLDTNKMEVFYAEVKV